jgi:hypothetical protein
MSRSLPTILSWAHDLGHEHVENTLHQLRGDFHVPGTHKLIQDHVRACVTCQQNKTEHLHPVGPLQPLKIPTTIWVDIAMDFVEGFPRVSGPNIGQ